MKIRLGKEQQIKIKDSADVYTVVQKILLRLQRIDRDREHFWAMGLRSDNSILYLELVSKGSVNRTVAEPMEVFSLALQKRAVKLILVHNHPSGNLQPSQADEDLTNRMVQVGNIVCLPVLDHVIINETDYYSFEQSGLLEVIRASAKYVPSYELKKRYADKPKQKAKR